MNYYFEILELIEKNDKSWTWYQLERGLSAKDAVGNFNLLEVISALVRDGLVNEISDSRYVHPIYGVTLKGKEYIRTHRIHEK